jgi:hypothetical protein
MASQKHYSKSSHAVLLIAILLCLGLDKASVSVSALHSHAFFTRLQPFRSNHIISKRIHPLRSTDDAEIIEVESINVKKSKDLKTVSARYVSDNDLIITTDADGRVTARPADDDPTPEKTAPVAETRTEAKPKEQTVRAEMKPRTTTKQNQKTIKKQVAKFLKEEVPKPVNLAGGFNVVLTHCTADFDSLASAVGLAKLWSNEHPATDKESSEFQSSKLLPTFVVLPRGAHPAVQKFLSLHKHLFPIRSLRSLPSDLSGLNRLGLVDAQRRDRVGPAEHLISYAKRVTIVDHHIEGDSDIPEATDYVVDKVGSVSAMIAEQLREAGFELSEAEATLLALGIHADTGELLQYDLFLRLRRYYCHGILCAVEHARPSGVS